MTAVEWYSNKLIEILGDMCNEFTQEQTLANHYALKQVNELFELQIKDAFNAGVNSEDYFYPNSMFTESETYYNETYKNETK